MYRGDSGDKNEEERKEEETFIGLLSSSGLQGIVKESLKTGLEK